MKRRSFLIALVLMILEFLSTPRLFACRRRRYKRKQCLNSETMSACWVTDASGRPSNAMRGTRPSSARFWNAYLNYVAIPASSTVWDTIGGSIGEKYGPPDENSCAARASYGLNYGGSPIEQFSAASVNLRDHSYKGKPGDGLRYIVSAMQMDAYLRTVWGVPDRTVVTESALNQVISSLAGGRCAIFATPNPPQGHGHAGVLKAGYSDPYVTRELPVNVWILQ